MSIKTIITRKSDNIITNIGTTTIMQGDNLLVDNAYAIAGINENYNVFSNVETADTIACGAYAYTVAGGFVDARYFGKSLADVQTAKINDMNTAYENTIYNTFTSTAFDGTTVETYACDMVSQSRINGEVTMALTVLQGYSTDKVSWKNVNQAQCVEWQPKNMIALGADLHKFETEKTDYLEALTVYINSLKTTDGVNKVVWGMTIPS